MPPALCRQVYFTMPSTKFDEEFNIYFENTVSTAFVAPNTR